MNTTNTNNVTDAYAKNAHDIERLLAWLEHQLKTRKQLAELDGVNWGHVGDLSRTRELLVQALAALFVGGTEEAVENLLGNNNERE